jgi:hypothetical protein
MNRQDRVEDEKDHGNHADGGRGKKFVAPEVGQPQLDASGKGDENVAVEIERFDF